MINNSPTSSPITSPPRRFTSPSNKSIIYSDRFIPSRISSHLDGSLISSCSPDSNIENENKVIHNILRSELLGQGDNNLTNGNYQSHSTSPTVLRYHSSVDDIERYSTYTSQNGSSVVSSSSNISASGSTNSYRSTSLPNLASSPTRISNSFEPSSTSLGGSAKKPRRKISRVPYKILDAPALQDDFYLNLVDWSKSNVLAVALGSCVYLWSAYTSKVVKLHDFAVPDSESSVSGTVTSVCWMNGGTHLAVGTSCGRIQVWDTTKSCKVRELHPHTGRVGSLAWNQQYCLLASGSKDKRIFLQDARIRGVFSPSRHINSNSNSTTPTPTVTLTPNRKIFPIHSDSPDLKPHHPILSSRILSSPSISTINTKSPGVGFYSSPQRVLANDLGLEEEGLNDDEFSQRIIGNDMMLNVDCEDGMYNQGNPSLSPQSNRRISDGFPPLPPSSTERRISKIHKLSSLSTDFSQSVFGNDDEDNEVDKDNNNDDNCEAMMLDEKCNDEKMKHYLEREEANESPVLRVYETMEERRSAAKFHSDTFQQWRNELPSSSRTLDFIGEDDHDGHIGHDNGEEFDYNDDNEEDGNGSNPSIDHLIHYSSSGSGNNTTSNQSTPPRESPHLLSFESIPLPSYHPKYNHSSSFNSRSPNSLSPNNNDLNSNTSSLSSSSPSIVHELLSHKQEVCGLKWSFDDKQLASGGNDNKLFIWNVSGLSANERNKQNKRELNGKSRNHILSPEHLFSDHTAAVKAIAWSPHQSGLLVSGGGTADRHMRFWNTQTGQSLHSLDTGSQVCNLMWSTHSNEIVSTHGYSLNQIAIWKYPSLHKLSTLTGHTYRVLYLAMSPNGQSIVTGAGDETLRFWNVFPGSKTPLSTGKGTLLQIGGTVR